MTFEDVLLTLKQFCVLQIFFFYVMSSLLVGDSIQMSDYPLILKRPSPKAERKHHVVMFVTHLLIQLHCGVSGWGSGLFFWGNTKH